MRKRRRLSRRDFLKIGGAASGGLALAACGRALSPVLTSTPIPPVPATATTPAQPACTDLAGLNSTPHVRGERYSASVPDTLDLCQRAELALRCMTHATDPAANHAPYDNMYIWSNPPFLRGTTMQNGKYIEAAALVRHMTGSRADQHVDQAWRSSVLESIADFHWSGVDRGRILAWLGNNFRIEENPCWKDLAQNALTAISQQVVHKDDFCFYSETQGSMPTGWEATYNGWVLQGLAYLYSTTGIPLALGLAGQMARYFKDHAQVFDSQGHFLARHPSDLGPALHFHHNGNALEGISAYALAAGDREVGAFVKSAYEWARSTGSPLVGFFPEYIEDWPDERGDIDCETCCTADMILMAMQLSESGQGDYWDDADRYVRNQFVEMQALDTTWMDSMVQGLPPPELQPGDVTDQVSDRLIGSFASWALANDWYMQGSPGTTFCCIGNGARALYYVWDKMIRFEQGTLRLNLLFNRASRWADVNSFLPYEGRVEIHSKLPCDLEVRIPEWVRPEDVQAAVDGVARQPAFRGRYALIGHMDATAAASITFPISVRSVSADIGGRTYALSIKGNDVLSIEPQGKWYPFYQRGRFTQAQAPSIDVERFAPAS